jgi:hypothetical protein
MNVASPLQLSAEDFLESLQQSPGAKRSLSTSFFVHVDVMTQSILIRQSILTESLAPLMILQNLSSRYIAHLYFWCDIF